MTPLKARIRAVRAVDRRRPAAISDGPAWAKPGSLFARFVDFCFGKNTFNIKALSKIRVYFSIRGRKGDSRKIKNLAGKNVYFCILLYTFHIRGERVLFEINDLTATGA